MKPTNTGNEQNNIMLENMAVLAVNQYQQKKINRVLSIVVIITIIVTVLMILLSLRAEQKALKSEVQLRMILSVVEPQISKLQTDFEVHKTEVNSRLDIVTMQATTLPPNSIYVDATQLTSIEARIKKLAYTLKNMQQSKNKSILDVFYFSNTQKKAKVDQVTDPEKFGRQVYNMLEPKYKKRFASVFMGQAALESSYGTSALAAASNNLFGIKCQACDGSIQKKCNKWNSIQWTDDCKDKKDLFWLYPDYRGSLKHYTNFITTGRYKKCYEKALAMPTFQTFTKGKTLDWDLFSKTDIYAYCQCIGKEGYATAGGYGYKVANVIYNQKYYEYEK